MPSALRFLAGAIAMCVLLTLGCDGAPSEAGASARAFAPSGSQLRIVSLSPALTRMATDLGAAGMVVGRTPWCQAPSAAVVGTLQECDFARLRELRPTLVLVQAGAADAAMVEACSRAGASLFVRHIDTLADVRASLVALAEALNEGGATAAPGIAARVMAVHAAAVEAARAQVVGSEPALFLFSVDPPTAFGTGTYMDDLWREMGGVNALARPGYPELSLEEIVRLDPARIVLVRSRDSAKLGALAGLPDRLKARIVSSVAPELLEPSSAFLIEAPGALAHAVRQRTP